MQTMKVTKEALFAYTETVLYNSKPLSFYLTSA